MVEERAASWSACFTSLLRAVHQVLDEEPKLLVDPIVVGLVNGSSANEIQQLTDTYNLPIMQLTRFSFILRNRIVEDMLKAKFNDTLNQFVILGAGLDTFAYRQPDWAKHFQIIEIDHPNSRGVSVGYQVGTLLSGELTPFIGIALLKFNDQSLYLVALYISILCLISLFAAYKANVFISNTKYKSKDLTQHKAVTQLQKVFNSWLIQLRMLQS